METTCCRVVLLLLVATVTVTEAMSFLALPRMGRSGYIAFPRMGKRAYLALPRLGRRSQTGSDGQETCCPLGLKTEWTVEEDGKTEVHNVCPAEVACCEGLQEVLDQKPDGAFYSLCIPSSYSVDEKATEASENVIRKLNGLLQN